AAHERADTLAGIDDPLCDQLANRLADRVTANAEELCELRLAREPGPDGRLAAVNGFGQAPGDLRGQRLTMGERSVENWRGCVGQLAVGHPTGTMGDAPARCQVADWLQPGVEVDAKARQRRLRFGRRED